LAEGFPILQAMTTAIDRPRIFSSSVKANWRLCYHITLDDYHIAAVHPATFGKEAHIRREDIVYSRFGRHSSYHNSQNPKLATDPSTLRDFATLCREGRYRSDCHHIFQFFPNLIVSHARSDGAFWHCVIQHYIPVAHDSSNMEAWVFRAPFEADHSWLARWTRPVTDIVRNRLIDRTLRRLFREDNQVCERLQSIARQTKSALLLGALEERIAWFEEAYRTVVRTTDS